MSSSNVQNQSNSNNAPPVAPSQEQKDMDLLSGKGDKSAVLMAVLGSIVGKENELRHQNAEMKAEAAAVSTVAAQAQGQAAMDGAKAEAMNEGISAGVSGASTLTGLNSVRANTSLKNDHDNKIKKQDGDIAKHQTQYGFGTAPQNQPEKLAKLQNDKKNMEFNRDHELRQHGAQAEHLGRAAQVGTGLSKMSSSMAQGNTQAATASARNASELAGQVSDAVKGNEETDKDVASRALQFNPGAVAVASTRG